jgi:NADPH-dependent curcumin reductase CurA
MNTRQIILQSRPLGAPTLQDFKIEDTTLEEMQSGRCYLKGYTIQ